MSDSPRKLRSPLAAYGPLIGLVAVIAVAVFVMFSMVTTRPEPVAPTPVPTPVSPEKMRERMGMPDLQELNKKVRELVKKYGYSWYDLPASEKAKLMREAHGQGQQIFERVVDELRQEEFEKTKKP
jgi:hypothetical protein